MNSIEQHQPKNKFLWAHVIIMFVITYGLFAGFFEKGIMMNSSDQVNALGIKTPIQQSLTQDGEVASWNRGILGGMPTGDALAGDYMYPPAMALSYVSPVYEVFGLKMILHIFIAGLFFYLMLWRGFAFPPTIALIGAIFYMLNPQFVSHIAPGHDGKMFVIAWLPFMVWHLKRIIDKPSILSTTLFGFGLGMSLLTSHIQMTYFVLWGLFAFWLMASIVKGVQGEELGTVGKIAAGFWGGVAIGMALGAVQFLPAYLFIQEHLSVRGADRTIQAAASWSLHWGEVFSLWVPELGNWFGYYWGDNPFKLNTEYAGAMAFLLSIFAVIRKPGKWRIFWSVVAIFSVAISLGLHTPIFKLAYYVIPGVKKFRALSMFMFWYSFATVTLSACFLKDIYEEFWTKLSDTVQKRWQTGVIVSFVVVTVIAVIFSMQGFTEWLMSKLTPEMVVSQKKQLAFDINFKEQFLPMLGLWWVFAVSVLVTLFLTLKKIVPKQAFIAVVLIVGLIDLLRVNYKFIEMKDLYISRDGKTQTYERSIYESNKKYRVMDTDLKKLQRKLKDEPFRVFFIENGGRLFSQNMAGAVGLEGINGFHDNELVTYHRFRERGQNFYAELQGANTLEALKKGGNHLNVANCRYLILVGTQKNFKGEPVNRYSVIENDNALPRFAFTNRFTIADTTMTKTLLKNKFYSAKDSVILAEKPEGVVPGDSLVTDITTKWKKYTANNREATVTVPADGILRIAEVWYPGWKITVNGEEVTPIVADQTWMALPLKAGTHEIVMNISSPFLPIATKITFPVAILVLCYWAFAIVKAIMKKFETK